MVLAKSGRQRTMLGRIVKRERLIECALAFRDISLTTGLRLFLRELGTAPRDRATSPLNATRSAT